MYALSHARADRSHDLRRRPDDGRDRADVHLPAAVVPDEDPEAAGAASRPWSAAGRTAQRGVAATGILGVRFDRDDNPWLGMQFQGGIAKFDRKTETFQLWSLPPELNGPHVQINQVSPDRSHVDGKVWLQDAGTYTVLRLDLASGKFEVFETYKIPRPNVYDVIPDAKNNGHFLVLGSEDVGRIDAQTGEIKIFKPPTPRSGPRRGMMDDEGRLW